MKFRLVFEDGSVAYYDNTDSSLSDVGGNSLVKSDEYSHTSVVHKVCPEDPTIKSPEIKVLKIQMGLKCNYSCSYCSQATSIPDATITNNDDADEFVSRLDEWLEGQPERIEFWGGEPLLYWKKIKRLLPYLREKFPAARFSMVTNGSLFTDEIIQMFVDYDIGAGISHDGPAQHLRGPDPFDDPEMLSGLLKFMDARGSEKYSINVVVSPGNSDLIKTVGFFREKLGDKANVSFEGIVNDYEANGMAATPKFTPDDYNTMYDSVMNAAETGELWKIPYFYDAVDNFMWGVRTGAPSDNLGQKCGMDRHDTLAVDLKGNAMTCQNTGAKGKHGLGSVYDGPVELTTAWHWSHRRECPSCPVLQICKGGCMFHQPDSDNWKVTCENEFRFALAKFSAAMYQFFGKKLAEVQGNVVRPAVRKGIPLKQL
ncbi:radical SAM protein [bacterium]|nr:radical SAM protein [bacterium]